LVPFEPEGIEDPVGWLPFEVSAEDARASFKVFASSSFWYPGDLRRAKVDLNALLLPAWAWSGQLETHWTGLVRASTRSGKRPTGGQETLRFEQVLLPASQSLRQSELAALGSFDESGLKDLVDDDALDAPRELSEVTRSVAKQRAQDEMERRHRAKLASEHSTVEIHVAAVSDDLEGKPVLVPVWIGAYRYGDKVYRVLVNGQSGTFKGDAPISWWRVAGVVLLVAALIGAIALAVSVCGGAAALAR
jgi:hypothetical protein